MPPIPWDKIFEIITKLIEGCDDPDPANVRGQLRKPRPLQRLRAERQIRLAMDLSPKQWRQDGGAIMAEINAAAAEASDEDLDELIQRAA